MNTPKHGATVHRNSGFSASSDAEAIERAFRGIGSKSKTQLVIVDLLCNRSNAQRQLILAPYRVMFGGKDLVEQLHRELGTKISGDHLESLIIALMEIPARYDAIEMHKKITFSASLRTIVVIEIMCNRTNEQIAEIKTQYRCIYGSELQVDLLGGCGNNAQSGQFKRLLHALCVGGRDSTTNVDRVRAIRDADAIYRAGTAEAIFSLILSTQNNAQLCTVFDEYQRSIGKSIEMEIEKHYRGDMRSALVTIVKCIRNRAAYFAERIADALMMNSKDASVESEDLIRLIVTRSEEDMPLIKLEFEKIYNKSLESAIRDKCGSTCYSDALLELINDKNRLN